MRVYRRIWMSLFLTSLPLTSVACEQDRENTGDPRQQYLTQRPADAEGNAPLEDRDRPIDAAVLEWLAAGMSEDQIRAKIAEGLQHNVLIVPMRPNIDQEKRLLTAGASVELIETMKTAQPPDDAYHPRERVKIDEVVVEWLARGMTEEEIKTKIERGFQTDERYRPMNGDDDVLDALRGAGASEDLIEHLMTHEALGPHPPATTIPQGGEEVDAG